MIESSSNNI